VIGDALVYVGDLPAATLSREPDGVTQFAYLPDYLAGGSHPVATTLPLSSRPVIVRAGGVPPFFAGLLPEGRRLTALRRSIKASADDELALLLAVGADLVGDVRVIPLGTAPAEAAQAIEFDGASIPLFDDLLADHGIVDKVGIAGVQDKVSARMISLPVARANERYILKLSPPEYPHVVENEAFFIGLARRLRMPVVDATVITDAAGAMALLVRRFDRRADGARLGVEDSCQALGLWPADKYNVTMEGACGALVAACSAPKVAAAALFQQTLFAWLTGNGDVHAKNISMLREESGEWRVSPAYDLPSTALYGDLTFALSVDGEDSDLSAAHFLAMADRLALPEPAARRTILSLVKGTADLFQHLHGANLPFAPTQLADLKTELKRRRENLQVD